MLIGDNPHRCIGKGFCGGVWSAEEDTDTRAIKREDGGSGRSITNNYKMHLRIIQIMDQYPAYMPLAIPQCHLLIQPCDYFWWDQHLPRFSAGFEECRVEKI
jgi:hypothetical protein